MIMRRVRAKVEAHLIDPLGNAIMAPDQMPEPVLLKPLLRQVRSEDTARSAWGGHMALCVFVYV